MGCDWLPTERRLLDGSLGCSREVGGASLLALVAGSDLTDQRYVASVFINGVSGQFCEPGLPRDRSAGLTPRWR